MDKFKIITNENIEKEVDGVFYLYNSKYFFAYTEKEVDEKGYVVFNLVQVGKEIKNTPSGPIDTGYMVGMEISDSDEWKKVQGSITKIVEDKKNGTQSEEIQYLPQSMLSTLKIISSKTFRLAKNIVEQVFNTTIEENVVGVVDETQNVNSNLNILSPLPTEQENQSSNYMKAPDVSLEATGIDNNINLNSEITNGILDGADGTDNISNVATQDQNIENINTIENNDVIIDYRASFFEEQEKNKQLEEQIKILTEKLENIKSLIG
ncbi:MAG: hypothetical protein IJY25_05400 [Bacilli bacterium]|nr:hypothetical protein [Bacilli bacterium]